MATNSKTTESDDSVLTDTSNDVPANTTNKTTLPHSYPKNALRTIPLKKRRFVLDYKPTPWQIETYKRRVERIEHMRYNSPKSRLYHVGNVLLCSGKHRMLKCLKKCFLINDVNSRSIYLDHIVCRLW